MCTLYTLSVQHSRYTGRVPTIQKKDNPIYQAQAILALRDHAEAEVRQKLKRKGFSVAQIEEAVRWLHEQKLLNDAVFAERYARSLISAKPVGPRWVWAKLKQKGVAENYIEAASAAVFAEHPEESLAKQATASWRRLHPNAQNERERLYRHLASRGFSPDAINVAISNTLRKN